MTRRAPRRRDDEAPDDLEEDSEHGWRHDAECLGWPEIGGCSRPARSWRDGVGSRESRLYCEECDELRRAHARSRRTRRRDAD